MRNFIKKFRYFISLRAVKITGLVLLVAAQAIPLGAFEGHIVSVTAVIEPSDPPALTDNLAGPKVLVLGVTDFATSTDPVTGTAGNNSADIGSPGVAAPTETPVAQIPTATPDATVTPDPTTSFSTDSVASPTPTAGSSAGDSAAGQPDATVTELEIVNGEGSLTIENSGAFADVTSNPVSSE